MTDEASSLSVTNEIGPPRRSRGHGFPYNPTAEILDMKGAEWINSHNAQRSRRNLDD